MKKKLKMFTLIKINDYTMIMHCCSLVGNVQDPTKTFSRNSVIAQF